MPTFTEDLIPLDKAENVSVQANRRQNTKYGLILWIPSMMLSLFWRTMYLHETEKEIYDIVIEKRKHVQLCSNIYILLGKGLSPFRVMIVFIHRWQDSQVGQLFLDAGISLLMTYEHQCKGWGIPICTTSKQHHLADMLGTAEWF